MRTQSLKVLFGVCLAAMLGASCSVERTQEAQAPDVDVDVDPGRWPQYDVNWADVDVGMTERSVSVPVVTVSKETRQVNVPYININPPGNAQREERTITMSVDVPHAGYTLNIAEVRAAADNLWVIARLEASGQASAQVLTRVSDQVVVNAPADLDVRKIVVGERPPGVSNEEHRWVASMDAIEQQIGKGARVIYQR